MLRWSICSTVFDRVETIVQMPIDGERRECRPEINGTQTAYRRAIFDKMSDNPEMCIGVHSRVSREPARAANRAANARDIGAHCYTLVDGFNFSILKNRRETRHLRRLAKVATQLKILYPVRGVRVQVPPRPLLTATY